MIRWFLSICFHICGNRGLPVKPYILICVSINELNEILPLIVVSVSTKSHRISVECSVGVKIPQMRLNYDSTQWKTKKTAHHQSNSIFSHEIHYFRLHSTLSYFRRSWPTKTQMLQHPNATMDASLASNNSLATSLRTTDYSEPTTGRDEHLALFEVATLAVIFIVTVVGNTTVLLALWTRRRWVRKFHDIPLDLMGFERFQRRRKSSMDHLTISSVF